MPNSGSLRRRLVVGLTLGGLVIWSVLGAWLYWSIRGDVNALHDSGLADTANLLEGLIVAEASEYGSEPPPQFISFLQRELRLHLAQPLQAPARAFQLHFGTPAHDLRSAGVPASGLIRPDDVPGFSQRSLDGRIWRVYSARPTGANMKIWIAAGEPLDNRQKVTASLSAAIGAALVGSFVLFLGLAWRSISWSLQPLARIRDELEIRSPGNLAPLPLGGIPEEVRPLVRNLNELLARLDNALLLEREFTANAAHELRTPIAGIRMQAQVAQRTVDRAERDAALAQVIDGVDRATRLIEQLLSLARVDPDLDDSPREAVCLKEAVTASLADLVSTPGIRVLNDVDPELRVLANAGALEVLLRNLLENAMKHGGDPLRLQISAQRTATGHVRLRIEDNGAGVPEERLTEILHRFVRMPGTTAPGSGLGLAIVARIAAQQHAKLQLGNRPEGGLCVELLWPTACPDQIAERKYRSVGTDSG